ncbi:MAG: hypothetical protein ABI430_02055 [Candidatus Taylorbacteria bacterium]
MEPRGQASFIPKKPVVDSGGGSRGSSVGLFSLISIILFVIVFLGSIGIFGYNYYLKNNIKVMDEKLAVEQKNIQSALIADLARDDKRIQIAEKILGSHTGISSLFQALQSLTLQTVQFKTFQFGDEKLGSFDVSMEGIGRGFNAVTLQSDIFRKQKAFKNPSFYDLALDENRNVSFKVKMSVDPSLLLYKISSAGVTPVVSPIVSPTASTTRTATTSSATTTNLR